MIFRTGDVLFTRGTSFFNRATCYLTGPAAHQATCYDSDFIEEADADQDRIVKRLLNPILDNAKKTGREWILFHWVEAPSPEKIDLMRKAMDEAELFERYSYIELPLQILDSVIARLRGKPRFGLDTVIFRRLGNIWKDGVICSKTSNNVLIKGGLIPEDSGLQYASPSDTYRYLIRCDQCVVLECSEGWFNYPGAKKDEIGRQALPGLLRRYPWQKRLP
jgi:hypothetical protein